MKATEAQLLAFLKKSSQFVIPLYQRMYSWTEKECEQLWDDIIRIGANDNISVHFVGSIVCIEDGLSQVSHHAPFLVIDGQQRLTTVTLLLAALASAIGEEEEPVDGFSAKKIRHYYLLNPEEEGERRFKLLLSQTDKKTLTSIVSSHEIPQEHSLRVQQNFDLFKGWINSRKDDLASVCNGLAKLFVVDIALNRNQENPQLIFESMNSTGRKLSQADLIRNFVLMGLEPALQTELYEQFWYPMESEFGQEAYDTHFDGFMRHYLTVKTGTIPRQNEVYEAFKRHARVTDANDTGIRSLVKEIRDYAHYYCQMALASESEFDPELGSKLENAFRDLRELKVDVAYPFLLELYRDYSTDDLTRDDFLEAVRLVETYVFRRAICEIPTNSMNRTFSIFSRALNKDRYLESIKTQFLDLPSYRRFPRDEEFRRDIQTRDLYNFRSRSYWLRRFENFDRKERVSVGEYTIEHIMPQNENLSSSWREAIGTNWKSVRETWLHTLGNLTLTGYNSEYSDRPFNEKRDMTGGFRESPLRVNEGLGQLDTWDEKEIKARAKKLAQSAIEVWPAPPLSTDIPAEYEPESSAQDVYTIEDHPNLQLPAIRNLFTAFSKEVLALDSCITENFLSKYVAYRDRAETNFVDVVPQVNQLRLHLNMPFADISDPKGICINVTESGHLGNGDVKVKFNDPEELLYIMGLVRQSLEYQLGNDEAA